MSAAVTAGIVAGVVGTAHYLAHRTFGDEVYFSKSGVNQAGLAVVLATFVTVYLLEAGVVG